MGVFKSTLATHLFDKSFRTLLAGVHLLEGKDFDLPYSLLHKLSAP